MLSNQMALTVCGQREKFIQSGGVEKPVKKFEGGGNTKGGVQCGWYKMSKGQKISYKDCSQVSKGGEDFESEWPGTIKDKKCP